MHYDFAGKEESKKRYEKFFDKLHKIPSKEVPSVLCGENLPELVICQNKDVLVIRKKPKVMMYQEHEPDSFDFKFSQVLLFSVVDKFEDLTPERVEEVCTQEAGAGSRETVVNKNKKLFYKLLLSSKSH